MEALVLTAFTVGLLGGVHCVSMCGGIVAAVSFQGGAPAGTMQRSIPLHLSYSVGWVSSYVAGGTLAGVLVIALGTAGIARAPGLAETIGASVLFLGRAGVSGALALNPV